MATSKMEQEKNREKAKQIQNTKEKETGEQKDIAGASCTDRKCPMHGNLKTRGRSFRGYVVKISSKRVVIEFERSVYIQKYERYEKRKTRIHAHLPDCMASKVKIGGYALVAECRPLSKMIHHVLIHEGGK
jgi:small subunit ribosomal protein S17